MKNVPSGSLFDDDPPRRRRDGAKDVELTAAERDLVIEALENRLAYFRAVRRWSEPMADLLERFKDLRDD